MFWAVEGRLALHELHQRPRRAPCARDVPRLERLHHARGERRCRDGTRRHHPGRHEVDEEPVGDDWPRERHRPWRLPEAITKVCHGPRSFGDEVRAALGRLRLPKQRLGSRPPDRKRRRRLHNRLSVRNGRHRLPNPPDAPLAWSHQVLSLMADNPEARASTKPSPCAAGGTVRRARSIGPWRVADYAGDR